MDADLQKEDEFNLHFNIFHRNVLTVIEGESLNS